MKSLSRRQYIICKRKKTKQSDIVRLKPATQQEKGTFTQWEGSKRQCLRAKFSMQGELQWARECLNKCCDSYTAHAAYRTASVYHRTGLAGHQQVTAAAAENSLVRLSWLSACCSDSKAGRQQLAAEQQCGVSCGAQGADGRCVCRVYCM